MTAPARRVPEEVWQQLPSLLMGGPQWSAFILDVLDYTMERLSFNNHRDENDREELVWEIAEILVPAYQFEQWQLFTALGLWELDDFEELVADVPPSSIAAVAIHDAVRVVASAVLSANAETSWVGPGNRH